MGNAGIKGTAIATAAAAWLVLAAGAWADARIVGHPDVIDGDGLAFGPVSVRLHGIDAAEIGQRCALARGGTWGCDEAAAERLAELVAGQRVECEPLDRDPYGRIVARCMAGGVDVGQALVAEGLAWAFRRYSDDYALAEEGARKIGAGVWQAETQPPWEYRETRWGRAAEASPREGCPIKGNVNRVGERIYHTPWSPWYGRTVIDEGAGERWFCDEAEAHAAGWRPARSR